MADDTSARAISHLQAGRSPVLDLAQINVLRRYGTEAPVIPGELLFADGDESYDLIVLLEGQVEIVQDHGTAVEKSIASYGPAQFLGEIDSSPASGSISPPWPAPPVASCVSVRTSSGSSWRRNST